jgi:hypothetical protein
MRQRAVRAILSGWVLASLFLAAPASALTAHPGQTLEVPFTVSAANDANTLTFRLVNVSAVDCDTMTVELYDGTTLLASVSGVPVNGIAGFKDAGSLWTENAVEVVLASIRSGTIVGRIRLVPDFLHSGSELTADVSPITSLAIGNGTDDATIVPIDGAMLVGSARIVPEPRSLAMLGVAAWWLFQRRKRI